MNGFQIYKKNLIKNSEAKGEKRGQKLGETQERQSGICKMIARLRKLSLSDNEIFQSLQEDYGSSFTDDQLMNMLNNTK